MSTGKAKPTTDEVGDGAEADAAAPAKAGRSGPRLKLYNTLTRKKEVFTPLNRDNVRMYVCGPTVYDYAHIGNARPVIVFDVLYRLLRHVYGEPHVTYVRNITDVDDKIITRARESGVDIRSLTEMTNAQFQADVAALGNLAPTIQPRATETIPEMIEMIAALVARGHAYAAEGHVLFDVKSFKSDGDLEYGKLARRSLDDMIAGARVEVAPYKRDPMDFVLWKPSTGDEPGWQSPWGFGRPGWHIECSAMSAKYLGETFDIHGGGIDLSFPHHENEIAQSRCAHGTEIMAQIFMHNGFLQVEGQKMSKSLGNFITIHDLLDTEKFGGRKWPGDVLRLAMLMTHYREPIDFSVARLEEAETVLTRWKKALLTQGLSFAEDSRAEVEAYKPCSKFVFALADDMNMSAALARLHHHAAGKKKHNGERLFASLALLGLVTFESMQALVTAEEAAKAAVETDAFAEKIAERLDALVAKNYDRADAIRAELLAQGVKLMDYKDEKTGERKTKWEMA